MPTGLTPAADIYRNRKAVFVRPRKLAGGLARSKESPRLGTAVSGGR